MHFAKTFFSRLSFIRTLCLALAFVTFAALPASAEYLHMDLKRGRVVIELRPDLAPKHVERIKELAEAGFYDGIIFHRVIDRFMAQTGDPTGTGRGGSGKKLPPEFTKTQFRRGIVGMARGPTLASADSQFFICFASAPNLDGQYTVWGQVVRGMEFVDQIPRGEPPRNPDRILKMRVSQTIE